MITVEDTGGAEIDTAAMAHLSLSTPEERRLHACDFHDWVTCSMPPASPPTRKGGIGMGDGAGLGIEPLVKEFGEPFFKSA